MNSTEASLFLQMGLWEDIDDKFSGGFDADVVWLVIVSFHARQRDDHPPVRPGKLILLCRGVNDPKRSKTILSIKNDCWYIENLSDFIINLFTDYYNTVLIIFKIQNLKLEIMLSL